MPSWKADGCPVQKFPSSMEPKVALRVPKSPTMNPTLRQVCSVHILIYLKFRFICISQAVSFFKVFFHLSDKYIYIYIYIYIPLLLDPSLNNAQINDGVNICVSVQKTRFEIRTSQFSEDCCNVCDMADDMASRLINSLASLAHDKWTRETLH
jgi:hypothetical protein